MRIRAEESGPIYASSVKKYQTVKCELCFIQNANICEYIFNIFTKLVAHLLSEVIEVTGGSDG